LIYNGIDRVDNAIGYLTDNCVACCKVCNRAKLQMSKNEFFDHIKKIYERNNLGDIHELQIDVPTSVCNQS